MSIPEMDPDLLQDFLVEAGEILEGLNQQLIDLEQNANDPDLLNAIFRGFHTVKGGAGFLNLTPLVQLCHRAEDVFNILRQGAQPLSAELMDEILLALDGVNAMFEALRAGDPLPEADPALLERLAGYARPETVAVPAAPATASGESPVDAAVPAASAVASPGGDGDEITDDEFEALLDDLHGKGRFVAAAPAPAVASPGGDGDEITDDEFEALLDDLHGKGRFGAAAPAPAAASPGGDSDEITDDEFEAVLDDLHGKGRFAATASVSDIAAGASAPASAQSCAPAATSMPTPAPTGESTAPTPAARKAPSPVESSVRVDTARLDSIMNLVGELVLVRNRLVALKGNQGGETAKAVAHLDLVTSELQTAVMRTRMQPIKKVFGRFPRVVRDLARTLRKKVDLRLVGEETEVDKNLVEALADPLVHLVRNSVDHGIEAPDRRAAAGKPETGTVTLSAEQEGDFIVLTIKDDGGGMDADKLKRIALEKGVIDETAAAYLEPKDCFALIFAPGFSTKEEITDVSGRGVGMDVVKSKITQLNGQIDIDSALGVGTTIRIRVPLTLAILPTLMFVVGGQPFAVPLPSVVEIFDSASVRTKTVDGRPVVVVRDRPLPLIDLRDRLLRGGGEPAPALRYVLIVRLGDQNIGLLVDHLLGQEEVVIKPLGTMLQGLPGLAGATIKGDGRIALILDIPSLLDQRRAA